MLDINYIEQNFEKVLEKLNIRNQQDYRNDLEFVVNQNKQRKELIIKVEKIKAEKNQLSKEIANLVRQQNQVQVYQLKQKISEMNLEIELLDNQLKIVNQQLNTKLLYIPNIPHENIYFGHDDNDNLEIKKSKHTKLVKHNTAHW
ncbi:seryl-tRNA synthetase, partial [Mycoplasma putrefaciens]